MIFVYIIEIILLILICLWLVAIITISSNYKSKNYYRITTQDGILKCYYLIKARSISHAEDKARLFLSPFDKIISIEEVSEDEQV